MDVYPGGSYLSQYFPDLPYIISNGVLPMGMKAIMFGPPKEGKSLVANQLALAVIHGANWFGFKTNPRRVLYFNFEVGHRGWQARLRKYSYGGKLTLTDNLLLVSNLVGVKLDTAIGQLEMEKLVTAHKPHLIILDPFKKIISSGSSNEEAVLTATDFCDKLIYNYGCSIFICHHTRKSKVIQSGVVGLGAQEMMGTYHLAQWVDSIISLVPVGLDKIRLEFECRHSEDIVKSVSLQLNRQTAGFEVV